MSNSIEKLIEAARIAKQKAIDEATASADRETNFLQMIAKLKAEKYPDLTIEYSYDRSMRYFCSALINKASELEFDSHWGCGCHPSAFGDTIKISPHIETGGIRIYSLPREIAIAEIRFCEANEDRVHWQADDGWELHLENLGFTPEFISKIRAELEENASCEECFGMSHEDEN